MDMHKQLNAMASEISTENPMARMFANQGRRPSLDPGLMRDCNCTAPQEVFSSA
jgi:hypothetical protein